MSPSGERGKRQDNFYQTERVDLEKGGDEDTGICHLPRDTRTPLRGCHQRTTSTGSHQPYLFVNKTMYNETKKVKWTRSYKVNLEFYKVMNL